MTGTQDVKLSRYARGALARPVPVLPDVALEGVLALVREGRWWYAPRAGAACPVGVPMHLMLGRDGGGRYHLALPLARDGRRTYLLRHAPGAPLAVVADDEASDPGATLDGELLLAEGDDPHALVEDALAWLHAEEGGPPPRALRPYPAWAERLGWCTWDAFYREVDHGKVLEGVASLRRVGVPPGFVILDDGWLDVAGARLSGLAADARRFPGGLGPTVAALKEQLEVEHVGAWHALTGYWAGVAPGSPAAQGLRLLPHRARLWPDDPEDGPVSIAAPEDAGALLGRLHGALAGAGIDFVKVDGQASLEFLVPDRRRLGPVVAGYQAALAASAARFPGGATHCMCHEPYTLHHGRGALWRTSDDYWPERPESHGLHVYRNAATSLLLGALGWPDWDMFQSDRPSGAFHAAARAISGGPVYVSDRPGHHDAALLERLCVAGGQLLRCDRPARVATEDLFVDPVAAGSALRVVNRNGALGVVGLFNCRPDGAPVTGEVRPDHAPWIEGGCWAWLHQGRRLVHLDRGARLGLELAGRGWELVTLAAAGPEVVPLGLLDKLNGGRAVTRTDHLGGRRWRVELADGGRAGFRVAAGPLRCRVDGAARAVPAAGADGLLVLDLPRGRPLTVEVELG